ncbi:MAG TPA: TetR/AcrR family transcriptional regulator, partial [Acidothermaceae bacterium]|nr:TetR/AcrR family transcriptional regulator [Acidothermaceae bacterium]
MVAPGPRERLLDAAERLTYAYGVRVGIDAILAEADVARQSLYEHFGGKDGLLVEMIRRAATSDLDEYRAVMNAAGSDSRRRLLAIFDHLGRVSREPNFRGCRYLAADLGLAEATHPAHPIASNYRRQVHRLLRAELVALQHPDPSTAADELHLLI